MSDDYRLSKTRFQLGLQCERALWLKTHRPELADPISEELQAIFDVGHRVGELATERFAGGVLVEADHLHSRDALDETGRALEGDAPALFEAARVHDGVLIRADVLARVEGDLFDLYEVKSSTRLKDENVSDVAIQLHVLEGAGVRIRRAYLTHLDSAYEYPGGPYDLDALFVDEDVTEQARARLPSIPGELADLREMLDESEPARPTGRHCTKPNDCPFFGFCHAGLPEYPLTDLPRWSDALLARLRDEGCECVHDIPADHPALSPAQRRVRDVIVRGEPVFGAELATALDALEVPAYFLDFETLMPALPLYPGTHPYQQIPFMYSLHVMDGDGSLTHAEYLHTGEDDPRPALIEHLLADLGDTGGVVVYTGFEKRILGELARDFPAHATRLEAAIERLFDLEKLVKAHVQHPEFHGRTSIKVTLPALVDDLSYDGLEVDGGRLASVRYEAAVTGRTDADESSQTYSALSEYCATDTLAMVRLYQVLRQR